MHPTDTIPDLTEVMNMRSIHARGTVLCSLLVIVLLSQTMSMAGTLRNDNLNHPATATSRSVLFGEHSISENCDMTFIGEDGGSPNGDEMGFSFATGDLDGDGINDLFVSSKYADGNTSVKPGAGEVYVYFGRDRSSWSSTFDLSTMSPDIRIRGNGSEDMFGAGIALGDVNGDHVDDLLVSAPGFGLPAPTPLIYRQNIGAVYVFYGGSRATLGTDINAHTDYDVKMYGKIDTEEMGQGLACADIDGDGIDDIITGSPMCSRPGYSTVGAVFILYGSPSLQPLYIFNTTGWGSVYSDHYDCVLWGYEQGSKLGMRLAAGDINGDSYADILVGSPMSDGFDGTTPDAGSYLVVLGNERATLSGEMWMADRANLTVHGTDIQDSFGSEVALGDVDADGFPDILATAPYADGPGNGMSDCGESYLTWASDSPTMGLGPVNGNASRAELNITQCNCISFHGADADDHLGFRCAMGDVNGDGHDDIVAASPGGKGMQNTHTNQGELSLVYGGSRGEMNTSYDMATDADLIIYGDGNYDSFGSGLHIGDIDGDGVGELMSSAMNADGPGNGRSDCGEAYVTFGSRVRLDSVLLRDGYDMAHQLPTGGTTCFAARGPNHLDLAILDSLGGSDITRVDLMLDHGGWNIHLRYNTSSPQFQEMDGQGYVTLHTAACTVNQWAAGLNLTMALTFDWDIPSEGPWDLTVVVTNTTGATSTTGLYPQFLRVENDLDLAGRFLVDSGLMGNVSTNGSWIPAGDTLTFGGLRVVYQGTTDIVPPDGTYDLVITEGDTGTRLITPTTDGKLHSVLTGPLSQKFSTGVMYTVSIENISKSTGAPGAVGASTASTYLRIDHSAPSPVSDIVVRPDSFTDTPSVKDNDDTMFLQWQGGEDTAIYGGSHFQSSFNHTEFFVATSDRSGTDNGTPALEAGGLEGRYYNTDNFDDPVLERMDSTLFFDQDAWGDWSPDHAVNVDHFSARWLGQLYCNDTDTYTFHVSANEGARIYIDSQPYLDRWDAPSSGQFQLHLDAGFHSIRVEYTESTGTAYFQLEWSSSLIGREPIPAANLFHSVKEVKLQGLVSGYNTIYVWGRDAFGNYMASSSVEVLVDMDGPDIIKLGPSSTTWLSDRQLLLTCRMVDDGGSGLDLNSIQLSIADGATSAWGAWRDVDPSNITADAGDDMDLAVNVSVPYDPGSDGTFRVRWRATDRADNGPVVSDTLTLMVDTLMPTLSIQNPVAGTIYSSVNVSLDVYLYDHGSGVDTGSIAYRITGPDGVGDWVRVGASEVNNGDIAGTVYLNTTVSLTEGNSTVEVRARDMAGNGYNISTVDVKVLLPPVLLPPIPLITSPVEGANISTYSVTLSAANTTDPDTPVYLLQYNWFLDVDTYLGAGETLTVQLDDGTHLITLYVNDGSNNVSTSVHVSVNTGTPYNPDPNSTDGPSDDGGGGFLENSTVIIIFIMAVVLLLILAVLVVLYLIKRKPSEEIRMELSERSEDDEEYDERMRKEEELINSHDRIVEKSEEELKREAEKLYAPEKKGKGRSGSRRARKGSRGAHAPIEEEAWETQDDDHGVPEDDPEGGVTRPDDNGEVPEKNVPYDEPENDDPYDNMENDDPYDNMENDDPYDNMENDDPYEELDEGDTEWDEEEENVEAE